MEIDRIIEALNDTSCDCHCIFGKEKTTVECTHDCKYGQDVKEAIKILEKLKTEPKIKLLSNVEAAIKVARISPYSEYAWLNDMEYIERAGLRICEVEE